MKINNSKHIITNEIVWTKQLLFLHVTFSSSFEISVVQNSFNISYSHANANLPADNFRRTIFNIYMLVNFTCLSTYTITLARILYIIIFARTLIIWLIRLTLTFTMIPFLIWITYTIIQSTFTLSRFMSN